LDSSLRGTFIDDDRIADPRGLAFAGKQNLLFLNSGDDRVLAISSHGRVVRETGRIEGLNPGGGNFGPDGRYFIVLRSECTIVAAGHHDRKRILEENGRRGAATHVSTAAFKTGRQGKGHYPVITLAVRIDS
jgi:hypothetical protein